MSTTFQEDLYKRIESQLPDQPFISTEFLSGSTIPADVGHFLTQALIRRATLEAGDLMSQKSLWIDFESAVVGPALERFLSSLSQAARYPKDEFGKSLERAVKFCTEYLTTPVTALVRFAVVADPLKNSPVDVRRRAGYFLFYPSVLAAFDHFLNGLNNETVSREAATTFLREQVETGAEALDAAGWIRIFESVFSIYSFTYPGTNEYPSDPFIQILDEYGSSGLAAGLKTEFRDAGDHLTREQITASVNQFFQPSELDQAAPMSEASSEPEDGLPLWKQFTQVKSNSGTSPSSAEEAPPQTEPLWKSYQKGVDESDEIPTSPKPVSTANVVSEPEFADTEFVLGDAGTHRERFIAELFDGNSQLFDTTLSKISSAESWEDASRVLSTDVFRKFRVDIYSDTAVLFTNAIEQQIRQRT